MLAFSVKLARFSFFAQGLEKHPLSIACKVCTILFLGIFFYFAFFHASANK